jgi:hypothetical protein
MLEFYFKVLLNILLFFSTLIRAAMVSKHSERSKRQARDCYGRFASPSSAIAPPPSRQEVRSFSRRCTAPPLSCMQEVGSSSSRRTAPPSRQGASSDDSVEIWVVHCIAPLRLGTPPPARLVAPPTMTPLEVTSSSDDSPSNSLGYNDDCPHVKQVSSYI